MHPRKTKIICTIGPASSGIQNLIRLIESGLDIARLNFSHGDHETHNQTIREIREASRITGKDISILQDLQGPKIRTGKMKNGNARLENGNEFVINCEESVEGDSQQVSTTYCKLVEDVKPGKILLLDDGYIILRIEKISGKKIITSVVKGGLLKDNKGIIAPGMEISAPSLSEKDLEDLIFGLKAGIDAVALSFVRSERDVLELKTAMKIYGRNVPVISKIERFEGYSDLDDIINESEGIMVARGDLGLELPPEDVPMLQKEIIRKCNFHGKPVITATQMLESMISNPRPTRAEASDVANAVLDGTDCVMLSGETSVGNYPFEAVEFMDKIIRKTEHKHLFDINSSGIPLEQMDKIDDALAKASCVIAEQIKAAAIIPVTKSGYTACNISKYRPGIPIVALTDNEDILRALIFSWGVNPILVPEETSLEDVFPKLGDFVRNLDYISEGDFVVFVAGLSSGSVMPENMIKVHQV